MDHYWPRSELSELSEHLTERRQDFYRHIESTGRLQRWRASTRLFRGYAAYGGNGQSNRVVFAGEQGEQVRVRLNHYAGIAQVIHTLITGSPPTTRAIAATDGHEGADQAVLANKLIDYSRKTHGLEGCFERAALYALVSGEGWVYLNWDPHKGRILGVDQPEEEGGEARLMYEGDVVCEALHPVDVWRDPDVQLDAGKPFEWIGVRRRRNRWNLVAQFPEHKDVILNASDHDAVDGKHSELFDREQATGKTYDRCYVNEWYHLPCPALPMGRYAWQVAGEVIAAGDYEMEHLPCYPMFPDTQEDSPYGFTPLWHLMGPQEGYDAIASAALTNVETFGVQNVWIKKGDNFKFTKLASGLNVFKTSEEPKALQLTSVASDAYKMMELLQGVMEILSGANSTMRGDPQANLKSGSALALVQSLAVQHNSGHHRSYANLVEQVYTGLVKLWQKHVTSPRIAEVLGDDEEVAAQEWSGASVAEVSRITVEMTNPVFSTSEGKKQLAEYLVANGMADRHEFLQVLQSGRLDPILKREESQRRMILRENDRLRKGEPVVALWTDKHRLHMREHAVLLDDPAIRFDPDRAAAIYQHINEHRDALFNTPMELLEAIGEPPPQGPPPGPPEGPGLPPGSPPGPGAADEPVRAPVPAVQAEAQQMGGQGVDLPAMPKMPAPGQQVGPPVVMG